MNNAGFESDRMADYLRLANLKGLTGKLRGRADREFAEMQNPDLGGTAADFAMPEQLPVDLENFDVRANQRIEPEMGENTPASGDSSIWSKLASGFKQGMQNIGGGRYPEQEDESFVDQMASQQAPISRPQESQGVPLAGPETLQAMTNTKGLTDIAQGNRQMPNGEPLQAGFNPMGLLGMLGQFLPAIGGGNQQDQETPMPPPAPPNASEQPQSQPQQNQQPVEPGNVQPGTVAMLNSSPDLKSKIDQYLGPVPPEMMKAAESYEKAMDAYSQNLDDVTARLTDQERGIRERLESRNLSTQDKILMAVALIAPLIISGLMGGKQAFVGALGSGGEAFAKGLGQRQKDIQAEEDKLSELALAKSSVGKEKAGIAPLTAGFRSKIAESLPNKDLRDIFKRDAQLIGDQLVLNSGNPNLPIKASAVRDVKDFERLKAEVPKLASNVATLDKAEAIIDSMHELADLAEMSKQDKNLFQKGLHAIAPFHLYDNASGALKAFVPASRDTIKDENGNQVKIAELLSTYRTQLADAWRDAHSKGANAFKATEEHFNKQLPDPTTFKSFMYGQSDINQFKKQLDLVKENFEEAINYIDQQGFDTTELKQRYGQTGRNKQLSTSRSNKQRAEAAANDAISKSQRR